MNDLQKPPTHFETLFVPSDFVVPEGLETDRYRLRMLTVHDVVRDFEAVTSSVTHLQTVWRTEWPAGLTIEQNLIDLGWHQKEFQRRRSFAYTVLAPDGSRVLGCVYIYPCTRPGFDAEIYLWARQDQLASGLEVDLEEQVDSWLKAEWPFRNAAFPGRKISWDDWDGIDG